MKHTTHRGLSRTAYWAGGLGLLVILGLLLFCISQAASIRSLSVAGDELRSDLRSIERKLERIEPRFHTIWRTAGSIFTFEVRTPQREHPQFIFVHTGRLADAVLCEAGPAAGGVDTGREPTDVWIRATPGTLFDRNGGAVATGVLVEVRARGWREQTVQNPQSKVRILGIQQGKWQEKNYAETRELEPVSAKDARAEFEDSDGVFFRAQAASDSKHRIVRFVPF